MNIKKLVALPALAALGLSAVVVQQPAHADSSPVAANTGYVWAVKDQSALSRCQLNGAPCPAGQVQVLLVHKIALSEAAAQHEPYISGQATKAELDAFVKNIGQRLHDQGFPSNGAPTRFQPNSCGSGSFTDSYRTTLTGIGATVDEQINYSWSGCTWTPQWHKSTYFSGHSVWKYGEAFAYDSSSGQWHDNDGVIACNGIGGGHQVGFSEDAPIQAGGRHDWEDYSSGSACTAFDTYQAVNYWWSH